MTLHPIIIMEVVLVKESIVGRRIIRHGGHQSGRRRHTTSRSSSSSSSSRSHLLARRGEGGPHCHHFTPTPTTTPRSCRRGGGSLGLLFGCQTLCARVLSQILASGLVLAHFLLESFAILLLKIIIVLLVLGRERLPVGRDDTGQIPKGDFPVALSVRRKE